MSEISTKEIKKLREQTGAGVMDVRAALKKAGGDIAKAKEILREKGLEKAAEKAHRETGQGLIETYIHAGGKIGAMIYVACETDFVAKTDEFKSLAKEVAMQVASMDPASVDELLKQEYIRDPSRRVKDLVAEIISKTGENVQVKKIARFSLSD
ncbi:MAG: translation elongation factor Ts [Candidatus Woykebacteria bacterium]